MSYNELGQLTSKARSRGYESQLFQYNIRGWLTRLGCEVFNEDLYYEKTSTGGQGCYNGNISQSRMEWMVGDLASDNWYMTEEYDYRSLLFNHTYDQLSRLTNTTSTDNDFSKFGEAMTYDKHGNIKTINRGGIHQHGWNYIYPNHTYGIIDNVTLSYEGNQLYNAIDLANDPLYLGSQDFKNYMTTYPGTEYRYDANGNLTDDSNKGIVTIRSNWLNLPDTVQMENGDMASYTYSPSGDKFMCIYSTANTSTVTMPLGTTLSNGRPPGITVAQSLFMIYMDNVVYEGNPWSTTLHNLSKVITDDGILVRTNSVTESTPVFERNYYIRDHLGNVRVVFDSQGRVRQLNNYTPFGMEYGESAGNQASVGYQDYKLGVKELDRRFELNWYNFGARSYDLALGRWTSMDPLAEKYYSVSPYVYCNNNPLYYIDPRGDTVKTAGTAEQTAYDDYKNEVTTRTTHYQGRVAKWQAKAANAKNGFGRFFAKAGLKVAQSNLSMYQGIQTEINTMESSSTVFMVRMGSNISAPLPNGSGGSVTYNNETNQIDINIGSSSMFSTIQIVAHEFKHGHQYLSGDLDFNSTGLFGGLFYDQTDEKAAFERMNLFGTPVNIPSTITTSYGSLDKGPKSFHLLSPTEQLQYQIQKSMGRYH
jgi:RHS repeat-associated protein